MSKPSAEALQLVKSLMELPENSICADCKKKAAKWASSTLGVFICIDCSGIHRSLGTHISFVRSCTLDSWTPEQARLMRRVGNKIANEYWEARLPKDFIRPATGDRLGMEAFIRAKYIEKRWAAPGEPPNVKPPSHTSTGGSVRPGIAMYEGYFKHNAVQQPQHSIMGGPTIPPSRSNESFNKKKFGNEHHHPNFAANASTDSTSSNFHSMNLDDFMNVMNGHQTNENSENTNATDSQNDHSSFSFMNTQSESSANAGSSEKFEVNADNPFGPDGIPQLPQPKATHVETPEKTPKPDQQKETEQQKESQESTEENSQKESNHSEERQQSPIPMSHQKTAALSPSAQEIMQQQSQEPKPTFAGKKKQSLFGKKSKASRFAKKSTNVTSPTPGGNNFVVDQMLNIAESSFRPVSAPVYQLPQKQIQFSPSPQQQHNYMMAQQQGYQPNQNFAGGLYQPPPSIGGIYPQSPPNGSLYQQQPGSLYQQPPQQMLAGGLYQQQPPSLYQQSSGSLYQQQPAGSLYQQQPGGSLYQQQPQQAAGSLYQQQQQQSGGSLYQQQQQQPYQGGYPPYGYQ